MFKLLRYFSLTALVSLSLAAAALFALFTHAAKRDLVTSAEMANGVHATVFANGLRMQLGEDFWRHLREEAPRLNTDQLRAHPLTERMNQVVRDLAAGTNVVKVKIFSLSGLTVYSSEAAQIGENKHNTELIKRAAIGEFASMMSQREKFTSFDGQIYNRSLVSTYIPAVMPGETLPSAVFELYADLTPHKQAMDRAHARQFAIVVGVMAALFLAQFLIVARGARIIRRQHEGLEAARRDVESARQAAEHANAAKSRFLANMSHEIRTPMHGMLGMTELLARTPLDETQAGYAATIARSGQALLAILNDILDLSKIESGKLQLDVQPFALRQVVQDVHDLMAARAWGKGLKLSVDLAADLPPQVEGDALRLQQVLNNLVGNAIKFTRSGTVTLTVRAGAQPHEYRFAIADTGIGIAPDVAARLFAPFVQADSSISREFGGSGLGLAIARQLVEAMGGRIGLNSTPGAGSEFFFTLRLQPCAQAAAAGLSAATSVADAPAPTAPPAPVRRASRGGAALPILLVEDNSANVLYAEAVLQTIGREVVVVNDGEQALAAVAHQTFALILMDCHMPVMDGLTATQRIRELEARLRRNERTPVIALSASAMAEERAECLEVGMDDFLPKPFSVEQLRAVVERWSVETTLSSAV
jgi:signal transduction histidine kinase/ActR/RegA family two-component response regulator